MAFGWFRFWLLIVILFVPVALVDNVIGAIASPWLTFVLRLVLLVLAFAVARLTPVPKRLG